MGYLQLFKSFKYAFDGIIFTIRRERNMRIHLVCMAYMYYYLGVYDFFEVSATQFAIILLANALVVGGELINTAVERAVDTATSEYNEKARIAKDAAAGAVLIFAFFSVLVGVCILWQPQAFKALFDFYVQNPLRFVLFLLSVAVFTLLIFLPGVRNVSDNEAKHKKDGKG